jgi:integrase
MAKRRAKGEGTIYQNSDGYWIAQITLPNGKRKTKSGKTQKEVKDWLLQERESVRKGTSIVSEKVTLAEYLTKYLETSEARLRPKTFASYKYLIEKHITPELGHLKVTKLSADALQSLYAKKLGEGLSRRTVQYMYAIIHKALDQAMRWGIVYTNVSDLTDPPRPKKSTPTIWSKEQAKTFLDSIKDDKLYPLYLLAITTGLRLGELLGIHGEDIDLDHKVLHIRHTVQEIRGAGLIISEPKTEKSKRAIKLPDIAMNALAPIITSGLIFHTRSGKPVSPRNLQRHFANVCDKIDVPRIRFHDLRHTCATLLLQADVHPKLVQELLGHSTISLTLDTYSSVVPGMHDKAADEMDKLFNA